MRVDATRLRKCAVVAIVNQQISKIIELHVFLSTEYGGDLISETDEMINDWYFLDCLKELYNQMWPSDEFILPLCLAEKKFIGIFFYDKTGGLVGHRIKIVDELPDHL